MRVYGVCLQDAGLGDGTAGCRLSVDASWLAAAGADGGVACMGGSLVSARFVMHAGGAFGAGGVADVGEDTAAHVVIEPEGTTAPEGETDGNDVPGGGTGEPVGSTDPAAGQAGADPAVKPAASTLKTTTTTATKTTVTMTRASTPSKPKSASRTTAALPKTSDSNWIVALSMLFLPGLTLLGNAYCC